MKVLMINGSPRQHGCTDTALREVAGTLEKHGIESELFWIGTKPVQGCMACNQCGKLGRCVVDDEVNALAARWDEFDAVVIGSPVYYAGVSGQLTSFLNRLFYCTPKSKLAGKPGAGIVSCRRGGATATFDQLNKYFTISNMPVVSSTYWNQVHGRVPESVLKDEEGLQTMRHLGENMAWMLKCFELGRRQGIPMPCYEESVMTDFIR